MLKDINQVSSEIQHQLTQYSLPGWTLLSLSSTQNINLFEPLNDGPNLGEPWNLICSAIGAPILFYLVGKTVRWMAKTGREHRED